MLGNPWCSSKLRYLNKWLFSKKNGINAVTYFSWITYGWWMIPIRSRMPWIEVDRSRLVGNLSITNQSQIPCIPPCYNTHGFACEDLVIWLKEWIQGYGRNGDLVGFVENSECMVERDFLIDL